MGSGLALEFTTEPAGELLVARLSGPFNANTLDAFRTAMQDVLQKGAAKALVLNLRNVQSIDSTAIGLLLMLRRGFTPTERFRLCEVPDRIGKVIRLAHFDGVFEMDSIEESARHLALRG